jgi:phosphotransacetylase
MDGITIVDPTTDPRLSMYIDELVEARKKKGLSRDQAADLLADENYFATMMVRCRDADGLVSGAIHTTAATVRPGMQVRLPSCVFLQFDAALWLGFSWKDLSWLWKDCPCLVC